MISAHIIEGTHGDRPLRFNIDGLGLTRKDERRHIIGS